MSAAEPRLIGGPLMLGLIALPLVFGWLLLRGGYATSTSIVVAIYAMVGPLLVALNALSAH
ncbi:hypothetical protein SR41_10120 [Sphingomonas melonis]|uniref:Uncharacterized protein n=1 Tax=Sphingomonas melonis TaxID=152682 RepID=A0A0D1MAS1_9SPHN|nr:hypothetical protein [Sphingomonas melonis]KIU27672.1 hypothetical protein SR41_10120 [Sphingomonas melonis]